MAPASSLHIRTLDMRRLDADRGDWLIGADGDEPVGVAIAAQLPHYALVGFVGVVPTRRGHGHALELLAAVTARLAATGASELRADTDVTNTPMVSVFARAHWRVWGSRVVLNRM